MSDCMHFPDTVEEFMEQYKMTDTKQVYSNGIEYVPIFRMEQWFEHEKTQLSREGTTSDLISRTETVEHFNRLLGATVPVSDYDEGFIDGVQFAISTVSTMPTIQPEKTQLSQEDTTSDLISRKQALNALIYAVKNVGILDADDIRTVFKALPTIQTVATDTNVGDAISKFIDGLEEIFADLRERHVDDSVCGLCEYDGAYMGQSGDWCNECPGFDRDDCFKLSDETRRKWTAEIIKALPTMQPEPQEGHWIEGKIYRDVIECNCSECGQLMTTAASVRMNYCPNCGAKMTISTK